MFSLHASRPLASPDPNLIKFLDLYADTLKNLCWHHAMRSLSEFEDLDLALLPVLPHRETLDILGAGYWQRLTPSEGRDVARAYIGNRQVHTPPHRLPCPLNETQISPAPQCRSVDRHRTPSRND